MIKQLLHFFGWKLNFDNDFKDSWQKNALIMYFNDQNTQFPLLQTEPRKLYDLLFSGSLATGGRSSDCKIPCLRTKSTIIEGPSTTNGFNDTSLYFAFVDEVKTKSVTVDKFEVMEALNFLGSNLGLWPGMGIFQLVERVILITTLSNVLEKISKFFLNRKTS